MIRYILAGLLLGAAHGMTVPVRSEPTKGYFTMDAMGCMLLLECSDGVKQVRNTLDVSSEYPNTDDFYGISVEFNALLFYLDQIGVKVFLAPEKYFPPMTRGVYHTVGNNFFLNKRYVGRPGTLISVMRHEGWHAAQDCMAGSIKNNMIAIIHNEEDVPEMWQEMARRTYKNMPHAIPWEKEAFWAGHTENMTLEAIKSCAVGKMWEKYPPTPKTREWLVENGFIPK